MRAERVERTTHRAQQTNDASQKREEREGLLSQTDFERSAKHHLLNAGAARGKAFVCASIGKATRGAVERPGKGRTEFDLWPKATTLDQTRVGSDRGTGLILCLWRQAHGPLTTLLLLHLKQVIGLGHVKQP